MYVCLFYVVMDLALSLLNWFLVHSTWSCSVNRRSTPSWRLSLFFERHGNIQHKADGLSVKGSFNHARKEQQFSLLWMLKCSVVLSVRQLYFSQYFLEFVVPTWIIKRSIEIIKEGKWGHYSWMCNKSLLIRIRTALSGTNWMGRKESLKAQEEKNNGLSFKAFR